jgi:hypothetical protein
MFFFSLFSSTKLREQEGRTGPAQGGGLVTSERGEVAGKGGRRVKYCVHMCVNAKMIPVETIPGVGGEVERRMVEEGEFKCDIFDTL